MKTPTWQQFSARFFAFPTLQLSLDLSRMQLGDEDLQRQEAAMQAAFQAMAELEGGSIANPDEGRMVGHYWLRAPELAPAAELAAEIRHCLEAVQTFSRQVHHGEIAPPGGGRFHHLLVIGIGGSALGPQFIADALGSADDRLRPAFLDNTDPDGFDRVLGQLPLAETLAVVISKSGGTKETRNGMLEAEAAWQQAGLDFARQAVAITGSGSELSRYATTHGWLAQFPMWDWVGGRTSVTSAVGLLPAALQGIDIKEMLRGAAACDRQTRLAETRQNPAALLALSWHHAGNGQGDKAMVLLPYKDRLLLFSRYLQQLVMESIGKEHDLAGAQVCQGLTVYGNKGSTDQHAYVQQLRDGRDDFFATFIAVLQSRQSPPWEVEPGVGSGDYLHGFLYGTRQALAEKGRQSLTLTIDRLTPFTIGVLIALYERAVGLYANLLGINAYHQPGVEAGKQAASSLLQLQKRLLSWLQTHPGQPVTAPELAAAIGQPEACEAVFHLLRHLAANPEHAVAHDEGELLQRRYRSS